MGKPRQEVLVLCQFDLSLGMGRLGAFSKYIENQAGTVEDFYLQCLFDIFQLFGRQFIVEDDETDFVLVDECFYFGQFPASDKCYRVGLLYPLQEFFHRLGTSGFGEESQLVEILELLFTQR